MSTYTSSYNAPVEPVQTSNRITSGRDLARFLRGRSAQVRAAIAAELVAGGWPVTGLTAAQAARLVRSSARAVHERLGHPPRRYVRSDREVDALVARIGVERVMNSLDRLTRPAAAAE